MDLKDCVALVTGAARRLGRGIALELARAGSHVVVHYRGSREQAERTAAEIRGLGVEAHLAQADLARPEEIDRLFSDLRGRFDRLDVLVNCAASFERSPFDEITAEAWDRVIAVNLRAPFLCTQQAARWIKAGGERTGEAGLIVNLVDLSGVNPWLGYAHHGVSKAGLLHLTKAAARELAPEVRVNAVVPGPILPPPGIDSESPDWRRIGKRVPAGRSGDPAQIGDAVVFLARNDFITGETIFVDGGEHLLSDHH
ncbi:MAG: SDR family oxidoreductase [Thermoanaerobaculia bacterium]